MIEYGKVLKASLLVVCSFFFLNLSGQVGQIIWEEDFSSIDTSLWNIVEGDGCDEGNCGWGNWELEYYHENNVNIEEISGEAGNYALKLEAKSESMGTRAFTSGKITSEEKVAFRYGVIEVRLKAPDVETGLWPAAWLLGTNLEAAGWPACGEIDMMEMGQRAEERNFQGASGVSPNNYVGANLLWYTEDACNDQNTDCAASIAADHWYNQPYVSETAMNDRFQIYRLYWDRESIRFTVEDEGVEYDLYTGSFPISADSRAFQKPFYMIMNLAVGGVFTDATTEAAVTAPLPGSLLIDYIRVRKYNGQGEVYLPGEIFANAGADIKVAEGVDIDLNASGSYGNITSHSWMLDGLEIANEELSSVSLTAGAHVVELIVTAEDGSTARDDINVIVGDSDIGALIWEEDFTTLNTDLWNVVEGDGCAEGNCGWGNWELEYYHKDNVYIEEIEGETGNYALVLEAKNETMGSKSFTSGKVDTDEKIAIKYGVVEVRMKVPDLDAGLWPAAWLLGINHETVGWPQCGEMDMMEMGHSLEAMTKEGYAGTSPNNFVGANLLWYSSQACSEENAHCAASIAHDAYYTTQYVSSSPMNDRFMTYRLYWEETSIRFTAIDNGTEYDLYTNEFPVSANEAAFRQPFYFILNLAVGGTFTGLTNVGDITAPLPAKMYVDYVKVSKWKGQGEVSFSGGDVLADAGTDIVVVDEDKDGSEEVTLDASASYGDIVSYEWFENGAQIAKDAQPVLNLANGIHHLILNVTDAEGQVSSDQLQVDVREIIWEDNFDTFDTDSWTAIEGDGCDEGNCGWGNQELESYSGNNISIEEIEGEEGNNALILEAKAESVGSSAFTSGKITTEGKVNLRYGVYEVRMQAPDVDAGLWPAAWLLGANHDEVGWPLCGELDMMEMGHKAADRATQGYDGVSGNNYVGANLIWYSDAACSGDNPTCVASIASDTWYNTPYVSTTKLTERFLIYRMYWDDVSVRFTVEDEGAERDFYTGKFPVGAGEAAFREPFYYILNLAVGGNFTDAANAASVTADIPAKLAVDYVRVMKWKGKGEVSYADGLVANAGPDAIVIDEDGDGKEIVRLDGSASSDYNGEIVSYAWTLAGVEISDLAMPVVEIQRGNHTIILEVSDDEGNVATDSLNVYITTGGLSPDADAGPDATYTDDDGDDLVSVTLDASGSEPTNTPIVSYAWMENDIIFSTDQVYTGDFSTGVHTIVLQATDEEGLVGEDIVIITVIDPDNLVPIVSLDATLQVEDLDGDDMVLVDLDGSACSDSDGTIESYSWQFAGSEFASTEDATIELSTGVYTIDLTICDDDGICASGEIEVTVVDPDNVSPNALAGADQLIVDADRTGSESCILNASASSDSDGEIVSYIWYEDDVEIASGEMGTIDLAVGEHTIRLELMDDDGDVSNDEIVVKVHQIPIAVAGDDVYVLDNDNNGAETVSLSASASEDPFGTIVYYTWTEEDTELGIGENVDLELTIGTHEILLIITDDDGATATDEIVVIVASTDNNAPIADAGEDIEVSDTDGNDLETITFDGSGTTDADGNIYSYTWLLDEAVIASGVNGSAELSSGEHEVVLEVVDNEGASDRDTLNVTINAAYFFEACTGDFKTLVASPDASDTWITFIPLKEGIGDRLCLLYYGKNSPFPGYGASPNTPLKMTGLTNGDVISFYYTYNVANGMENSTVTCQDQFVVGASLTDPNVEPVADAGADQILPDTNGESNEDVSLDGSGSYDSDGVIVSYVWKEGSKTLASTEKATVTLNSGSHTIVLTVTDNRGAAVSDEVQIDVAWPTNIDDYEEDVEVKLYPSPVDNVLYIEASRGSVERVQLYSSVGALVSDIQDKNVLDVSAIPAGFYVVKVTVEGRPFVHKVLKR